MRSSRLSSARPATAVRAATVVGDTVGDPFKDTSSVSLNPVIKFTTLFDLLAVQLAVGMEAKVGATVGRVLAVLFFIVALIFAWRSFYGMRIVEGGSDFVEALADDRMTSDLPGAPVA